MGRGGRAELSSLLQGQGSRGDGVGAEGAGGGPGGVTRRDGSTGKAIVLQRDEGGPGVAESCVLSCSTTVSASACSSQKRPLCRILVKGERHFMFLFRITPKGIYVFTLFGVAKASAKLRCLGGHEGVEGAPRPGAWPARQQKKLQRGGWRGPGGLLSEDILLYREKRRLEIRQEHVCSKGWGCPTVSD